MENLNTDIDNLINFLISNFIDEDKYEIEKEEKKGQITYTVWIEKKYIGKVLGRNGKIANSIREIAKSLPNIKKKIFIKFNPKK